MFFRDFARDCSVFALRLPAFAMRFIAARRLPRAIAFVALTVSLANAVRGADLASLKDIVSGTSSSTAQSFVELGGKIYFTASNGTTRQLYRYDSTAASALQVTQISSFTG